jgi:hypothetical protein
VVTVAIYRNLRTKTYSVLRQGRVVDHPIGVVLEDVSFKVRQGGRKRVLQERRKNVHAFIVGTRVESEPQVVEAVRVRYNPYEAPSFIRCDTGEPVLKAKKVWAMPDGVFAQL